MRRLFFVLLLTIPAVNGCKKSAAPTTDKGGDKGTEKVVVPVKTVDPEEDLAKRTTKFFADLKANSPERRANAIEAAAVLEGDGADLTGQLLEALKDPGASPLGDTSYDKAKSTREAAVLALLKLGADGKKALLSTGLKTLQAGLADAKPNVREHTANAIGMIGPDAKPAVESLIKLCADKDQAVRSASYRSLERIKTVAPAPILKLLVHAEPAVCQDAALALSWLKPTGDESVTLLIAALKSTDLEKKSPAVANTVRFTSAEALGKIGSGAAKAVPELIEMIKKSDIEKLEQAMSSAKDGRGTKTSGVPGHVQALRKIGAPAIPPLVELLKDREPVIRYQAAMALGGMGKTAESALPEIMQALEGERDLATSGMYVFEELANAALNLGGDARQILTPVSVLLRDTDNIVKARAAGLVKRIGRRASSTIPRLIDLLKEGDERILEQAVGAIAIMGPLAKDATPDLVRLIGNEHAAVSRGAVAAIASIGPDAASAVPALVKGLESSNQNITSEVAEALGAIGPEAASAVPALVKVLGEKSSRADDRQKIIGAIANFGPKGQTAIPDLIKLMNDREIPTRIAASQALASVGSGNADAVARLVAGLKDSSLQVQISCIRALASMGPGAKSATPELKAAAEKSKEAESRIWGSVALVALGVDVDPNFKVIQAALKDKSPAGRNARGAAIDGLSLLGSKVKLVTADLIDALKEKTPAAGNAPSLRERAAMSISKMGPDGKATVAALTDLLRDPEERVRKAAILALGGIGPEALLAAPKLRELPNDDLAIFVQRALDRIEPPTKKEMP
jgi:HEAT repeat protein